MSEVLTIADLHFQVRRSQRRRTLGLTVDRFGDLVVHAPELTDTGELRAWIEKKLLWVNQKLLLKAADRRREKRLQPVSGETISYLGRNYRLRVVDQQADPFAFDGYWFTLRRRDKTAAPLLLQEWYERAGGEWLAKRVMKWQRKAGTTPSGISVADLGFRWASCSKSCVVRFNWKLLQLPVRLIDYVIAHELVHLKEHSHSPKFWKMLGETMPDWRARKDELAVTQAELAWSKEIGYPSKGGVDD